MPGGMVIRGAVRLSPTSHLRSCSSPQCTLSLHPPERMCGALGVEVTHHDSEPHPFGSLAQLLDLGSRCRCGPTFIPTSHVPLSR